jgi:hypothetical protein
MFRKCLESALGGLLEIGCAGYVLRKCVDGAWDGTHLKSAWKVQLGYAWCRAMVSECIRNILRAPRKFSSKEKTDGDTSNLADASNKSSHSEMPVSSHCARPAEKALTKMASGCKNAARGHLRSPTMGSGAPEVAA